jgi:hypothetical protein
MSIKIITSYEDPEFKLYENYFWKFSPDDWDYIIIGENSHEVESIAEKLYVCDYQMKEFDNLYVAVTYHS